MDLFSVLAHEDQEGQQNLRKATSVATKRVSEQFGSFLAASESLEQYLQRYDFAFDDLKNTVAATAEEYDVSADTVLAGVEARFKKSKGSCACGLKDSCDGECGRTASTEKEARRPKLCPYHSEVTDISLAQGEPRAGFDAMAQHAWGPQHCQGGEYEGGRCNFRREMVTQSYWDEKAEQAQQRAEERAQQREQEQALEVQDAVPVDQVDDEGNVELEDAGVPVEEVDPFDEVSEESHPSDTLHDGFEGGEPVEEPAVEEPMAMAASSDDAAPLAPKTAASCGRCGEDGVKTGKPCPNCGYTGGGEEDPVWGGDKEGMVKEAPGGQHSEAWGEGGSKRNRQYEHIKEQCLKDGKSEEECKEMAARTVNKTRAEKGETKGGKTAEALETVDVDKGGEDAFPKMDKSKWTPENLEKRVDTEMDGSPHPTKEVDILEPITPENEGDFLEGTDAVTEHQDVTKAEGAQQGKGGTFPKGNGANPVSSNRAENNPVRQVLEEDDGFPEDAEITAAISAAR